MTELTEEEILADYEQIMSDYQKDDEWDLPAALFIRWDDKDMKGCIIVIPTEDPKMFLQMLQADIPMAQAIFRNIGEVPEDTPIASVALINEGWGLHPEDATKEEVMAVELGLQLISESEHRVETRLIFAVTKNKGVYFGSQDRGGNFEWVSRTDNPDGGSAGGLLPGLIYPLVTGEQYATPEALLKHRDAKVQEYSDLRYHHGPDATA